NADICSWAPAVDSYQMSARCGKAIHSQSCGANSADIGSGTAKSSAPAGCGASLVTDTAEFVVGVPVGPVVCLGQIAAEQVEQLQVFLHAAPVPVGIVLVVGAMVHLVAVHRRPGCAGFAPAFHQVLAAVEIEHRHPALGQAEVIGAVVVAR